MTEVTRESAAPPAELTWADPGSSLWRRVRAVLLVAALVLSVLALTVGERPASLATLERHVAAGQVDAVQVAGGLSPGAGGFATVQVRWRSGGTPYRTEVIEARPLRAARGEARRDVPVIRGDLRTRLTELQPGLRIESFRRPSSEASVYGWFVPSWYGSVTLPLVLGVLVLLVVGPRPWRATRWAWFWLVGAAPPGILAFLVLSGPTPGLPAPAEGSRRMTGGWAFLIALGIGALIDKGA